ncbi:MAG: DUF2024 family protein [Candidatus Thiodiazotropha taylori]
MKIDIYDSRVQLAGGDAMHFDILLPSGEDSTAAIRYARQWLRTIGIDSNTLELERCQFCHTETATPELQHAINTQGFAVIQMEGCPAPV